MKCVYENLMWSRLRVINLGWIITRKCSTWFRSERESIWSEYYILKTFYCECISYQDGETVIISVYRRNGSQWIFFDSTRLEKQIINQPTYFRLGLCRLYVDFRLIMLKSTWSRLSIWTRLKVNFRLIMHC